MEPRASSNLGWHTSPKSVKDRECEICRLFVVQATLPLDCCYAFHLSCSLSLFLSERSPAAVRYKQFCTPQILIMKLVSYLTPFLLVFFAQPALQSPYNQQLPRNLANQSAVPRMQAAEADVSHIPKNLIASFCSSLLNKYTTVTSTTYTKTVTPTTVVTGTLTSILPKPIRSSTATVTAVQRPIRLSRPSRDAVQRPAAAALPRHHASGIMPHQ